MERRAPISQYTMADFQLGRFCVADWRQLQTIRGYTLGMGGSYIEMVTVIWMKCLLRNFLLGLMGGIVRTLFISQPIMDILWVAHMLQGLHERH